LTPDDYFKLNTANMSPEQIANLTETEIKKYKNIYELDKSRWQRYYDFPWIKATYLEDSDEQYNAMLEDIKIYFDA